MSRRKFTIGADPEFAAFPRSNRECIFIAGEYCDSNCLGIDGGDVLFELRPDPSTDPLRVVDNIHRSMLQIVEKYPKIRNHIWYAGSVAEDVSERHTLGGHIHFGCTRFSKSIAIEWLDQYLATTGFLLEDFEGACERRRSEYGQLGDFRDTDYGFEYRTLSSWLTSPYIAAGLLCLATVVFDKYLLDQLRPTRYVDTISGLESDDLEDLRETYLRYIWPKITRMPRYKEFQPQIDLLYRLIKAKRNWFPNVAVKNKYDIKPAWGIMNIHSEQPKVQLADIWKNVK